MHTPRNWHMFAVHPRAEWPVCMAQAEAGFVYVLSNDAMPGIVKIGMTTRDPSVRLREINSATGVLPFRLEVAFTTRNARQTEKEVHQKLFKHRISNNREFFRIKTSDAIQTVMSAARNHGGRRLGRKLEPLAATIMGLSLVPVLAAFHIMLVPLWMIACVLSLLTRWPASIRSYITATDSYAMALIMLALGTGAAWSVLSINHMTAADLVIEAMLTLSILRT